MAITASWTLAIVARYGVSATLRSWPAKSYSVTTGITTLGTATDTTVTILPPYARGPNMERYGPIQGDLVVDAETVFSPYGVAVEPAVGMHLIWDSRTWVILAINRINYKGSEVLYELALAGRPAAT